MIAAALFGCAESASAQIFGGWFWTCQNCAASRCAGGACNLSNRTATAQPAANQAGCATCTGEDCNADPVEPCEPCESTAAGTCVEPCESCPLSAFEAAIVNEINRVRGGVALRFDAAINRRAQNNANYQATYCQLGHFSGDPNEIAARGYTSARAAVAGWLNSPNHRRILLNGNYKKIGACVRQGRDGLFYFSVNFGY